MGFKKGSRRERVLNYALRKGVVLSEGDDDELLRYVCSVVGFKVVDGEVELEARDEFNLTPLMKAVQFGDEALCRFLLKMGSDVNAVGFRNQERTPLMLAALGCRENIKEILLEAGARTDIEDHFGKTVDDFCSAPCRLSIES